MIRLVVYIIIFLTGTHTMALAQDKKFDDPETQKKYEETRDYLDHHIDHFAKRIQNAKEQAGLSHLSDDEFFIVVALSHCKKNKHKPAQERIDEFIAEIDDARTSAQQALRLFCIGRVYEENNDFENAKQHYSMAHDIDPEDNVPVWALKELEARNQNRTGD